MEWIKEILNKPGLYVVLTIIALVFLITAALMSDGASLPERIGKWESSYDFFICDTLDLQESKLDEALQWWRDRNYELGLVFAKWPCEYDHKADYSNTYIPRTVLLYPVYKRLEPPALGLTSNSLDTSTGIIHASVIELYSTRQIVLIHEIGHALGWGHTNIRNHVMNPKHSNSGWKDDGLVLEP